MDEYLKKNVKVLCVLYAVYFLLLLIIGVLMYTDLIPPLEVIAEFFGTLCIYGYLPISAIIFGSLCYIQTEEIMIPSLCSGLGYVIASVIAFLFGATAKFDIMGASNWWEEFSLLVYLSVDFLFWIKLPLLVLLTIISGLITKLIVSIIRKKKLQKGKNESTPQVDVDSDQT